MLKTFKKLERGFTIIELLIVIAIIAILAGLVITNYQGAQAKARDNIRVTNINSISSKLEEYHNENGAYPNTFDASTFPGIDETALLDPRGGNSINILSPVADEATAEAAATDPADDTTSSSAYNYIPYPTGCTNDCTGFVLKTFIEQPNATTPNPYVKKGTNNN